MSTANARERDRIFLDVPLSEESLRRLHFIAEEQGVTPVRVLRQIVEGYRRNGKPQLAEELEGVYRGVPLTHAFLRDLNEMAAEYQRPPLAILKGIVEGELERRVPALA
jgi:hypothetical protein